MLLVAGSLHREPMIRTTLPGRALEEVARMPTRIQPDRAQVKQFVMQNAERTVAAVQDRGWHGDIETFFKKSPQRLAVPGRFVGTCR
jgi:wyosine [tRNA(Phe)-imidazoG37] synthetase (radical SAM superfamily)